jgi:hypothetical protein
MARLSFFTLLLTAVVVQLSLTAVPSAHALQGMNLTPPMVKRAEHVNLNQRMIKKKRQTDVPINPIADPTPSTSTSVSPTSTTPTPTTQVPPVTQVQPTRTTVSLVVAVGLSTQGTWVSHGIINTHAIVRQAPLLPQIQ